jgi:hypothetical protein
MKAAPHITIYKLAITFNGFPTNGEGAWSWPRLIYRYSLASGESAYGLIVIK